MVAGGGAQSVSAPLGTGSVEVLVDPAAPAATTSTSACSMPMTVPTTGSTTSPSSWPYRPRTSVRSTASRCQPGRATSNSSAPTWTWPVSGPFTVTVKPDRFTEQTATVTFQVR